MIIHTIQLFIMLRPGIRVTYKDIVRTGNLDFFFAEFQITTNYISIKSPQIASPSFALTFALVLLVPNLTAPESPQLLLRLPSCPSSSSLTEAARGYGRSRKKSYGLAFPVSVILPFCE